MRIAKRWLPSLRHPYPDGRFDVMTRGGSGGLRLCPLIYNTGAHILRAIDGVASMRGLIRV
jgi:hypothetical protein